MVNARLYLFRRQTNCFKLPNTMDQNRSYSLKSINQPNGKQKKCRREKRGKRHNYSLTDDFVLLGPKRDGQQLIDYRMKVQPKRSKKCQIVLPAKIEYEHFGLAPKKEVNTDAMIKHKLNEFCVQNADEKHNEDEEENYGIRMCMMF